MATQFPPSSVGGCWVAGSGIGTPNLPCKKNPTEAHGAFRHHRGDGEAPRLVQNWALSSVTTLSK